MNKGDIVPQDKVLYFIKGRVRDGVIVTAIAHRDYVFESDITGDVVYAIVSETKKQYKTEVVRIDEDNRIVNEYGHAIVKKSEMTPMPTPGMHQEITRPCVGMFTFHKSDAEWVEQIMGLKLVNSINELNNTVEEIRSILEMSK